MAKAEHTSGTIEVDRAVHPETGEDVILLRYYRY
jgi:hypothetical protein